MNILYSKCGFAAAIVVLSTTMAWGVGNETINVLPDSNKSDFRTTSRTFWKEEFPESMAEVFPYGALISGGSHGTSGTCTSAPFPTIARTNKWNRVQAKSDGTGGSMSINYTAMGLPGCASGTSSARVAVCAISGNSIGFFNRVPGSNYFVNYMESAPEEQPDCLNLMDVTVENGAITQVRNLQRPADVGWQEIGNLGLRAQDSGITAFFASSVVVGTPPPSIWHKVYLKDLGIPADAKRVELGGTLIITHGTTFPEICDVTVTLRAPGSVLPGESGYLGQTLSAASALEGERSSFFGYAPVKDGAFEIFWQMRVSGVPIPSTPHPLHCAYAVNLNAVGYVRAGFGAGAVEAGETPIPEISEGIINVQAFGAVGDDNPANNAVNNSAFQAALNAVSSITGNTVYIPPGTYCLSSDIIITKSKTNLTGAGRASRIKNCGNWTVSPLGGATPAQINIIDASITAGPTGSTPITDVTIGDVEIVGIANAAANSPVCISSIFASRILIKNVHCVNQPRNAIAPMAGKEGVDWKVLGSTFTNTGQSAIAVNAPAAAIVANAQGFLVSANTFNAVTTAVSAVYPSGRTNITGNLILLPTLCGIEVAGNCANTGVSNAVGGTDEVVIDGNVIVMNGSTYIKRAIAVMEDVRNVNIGRNTIRITTFNGGEEIHGIALHGPSNVCSAQGNTILMDASPGNLAAGKKFLGIYGIGGLVNHLLTCTWDDNNIKIINNTTHVNYGGIFARTVSGETYRLSVKGNYIDGFSQPAGQFAIRVARNATQGTLFYAAVDNVATTGALHEYGDLGTVCNNACGGSPVTSVSTGGSIFLEGGLNINQCPSLTGLGAAPPMVALRCCSDCNPNTNPCTAGGTGALAYSKTGGVWVCP